MVNIYLLREGGLVGSIIETTLSQIMNEMFKRKLCLASGDGAVFVV